VKKCARSIERRVRAVIDTNVWISAILNPGGAPAAIRSALDAQRFTLVTSESLLNELREVLSRPRFARLSQVTPSEIDQLLAMLSERGETVPLTGSVELCRDPDDNMVIETALVGNAEVLVTRDDDLKGVSLLASILRERGVTVLSLRQFLEHL
jgi:putative PIN family toxin of toxin-antitoxin system